MSELQLTNISQTNNSQTFITIDLNDEKEVEEVIEVVEVEEEKKQFPTQRECYICLETKSMKQFVYCPLCINPLCKECYYCILSYKNYQFHCPFCRQIIKFKYPQRQLKQEQDEEIVSLNCCLFFKFFK